MSVNIDTARRLAYIRYLHQLGIEQARLPEPLSSASILMLHDAVETYLLLAAERFGVTPPTQFEKYWETLAPHVPGGSGLAVMQGMRRLNRVRVALKHHGAYPSTQTIEQAVTDTATFMTANTQLVFGLDYDTISMVQVISQPGVRRLAETAEAASAEGDYVLAMMRLREAFDGLFAEHEQGRRFGRQSALAFGPPIGSFRMSEREITRLLSSGGDTGRYSHDFRRLGEQISNVVEITDRLRAGMRLTAVGLDYSSYLRFMNVTPSYNDTIDGTRHWRAQVGYAPDRQAFEFSLQFIVTASLRLAAAEVQVTDPTWVSRDQWGRVQWRGLVDEPINHDADPTHTPSPGRQRHD